MNGQSISIGSPELWLWIRVSVQGVKSLGGHFACLCRGFWEIGNGSDRGGASVKWPPLWHPCLPKIYHGGPVLHSMDEKKTFLKIIYLWPTWNTFKLKILITSEIFLTQNNTFFASIKYKLKVVLTLFLDTLSSMAEPGTGWWRCFSTGELLLRRAFTQHGQANQPL